MNKLDTIKEHILSRLNGGDALLIVPPFTTNSPSIGPHILQAGALERGYSVDILYLNLLLASIIGFDLSEKIGTSELFQYWIMLNERLFAASAYGLPPLGNSAESCTSEALSTTGRMEDHKKMDYDSEAVDMEKFFELEKICASFVDEAVRAIASLDYAIVGCTARMGQTNCSVALLNGIKKIRPQTTTIMGGSSCLGEMAEGIASLSDSIDYIFSGESDISFPGFLTAHSNGELPGERIITGPLVEDLDSLPIMDYGTYFTQLKSFFGDETPEVQFVWLETSRGCWWGEKKKCTFCSRNNESLRFRQKSSERALEELSAIKEEYPGVAVAMADNIMPHSYNRELMPKLAEKKDFPHICLYYTKANFKLKDLIHLRNARVDRIIPGMEALSTGLLKLLNKGVTAGSNLQLLRNARSLGVHIFWFMLWGMPGDRLEFYEEILKILPLIRHLEPPQKFFRVQIERFSNYFEDPSAYSITNLRPWAVYTMIYPEWANIDKIAFNFTGEFPCESDEHPEIIRDIVAELDNWRKVWKNTKLLMIPFADIYMIYDSRNPENEKKHILESSRAREIMKYAAYTGSEDQEWAVQEELGIIVDSWYTPLVMASAELLSQFSE
ncbi:MAG: RiPP maturation radical SAM protein 1 [bacterium]|nr:RiPP maturation radical SAM protein 1 [bacterium]